MAGRIERAGGSSHQIAFYPFISSLLICRILLYYSLLLLLFSVCRNVFECPVKPQETKSVPDRKKSFERKQRSFSQELPQPLSLTSSPKAFKANLEAKEPQNQADLVKQALLAQQATGLVKPETVTKIRSNSQTLAAVREIYFIRIFTVEAFNEPIILVSGGSREHALSSPPPLNLKQSRRPLIKGEKGSVVENINFGLRIRR